MNLPFKVDLSGKTAVVTGGGGVLCAMFAEALGQCGAKVAILDLSLEKAQAVAKKISSDGGVAIGLEANVLSRESLAKAAEEIFVKFGECDILINGAGGNHPKGTTSKEYFELSDLVDKKDNFVSFFDLDIDGVKFVFDLNFIGTLLPTQIFAMSMAKKPGSCIINISSMNAFTPLTRIPAYSAAKAAVSNFTQWLAVHFSKVGIRVNAIAPGFFLTDQNAKLLKDDKGNYTERAEKILSMTPTSRFGEADELLGTLLWLADTKSSGFVNGIVVPVDGGFQAYSGV